MSRLKPFLPEELDEDQTTVYRRMTATSRGAQSHAHSLTDPDGALTGPPNAWLLNPGIGLGLEAMGEALLTHLTVSRRVKEIVILTVASELKSEFELYAHRLAAIECGLSEQEIDIICGEDTAGRSLPEPTEDTALQLARQLITKESLDQETFDVVVEELGLAAVFDITVLVGHYRSIALQLAVFDIRPPN